MRIITIIVLIGILLLPVGLLMDYIEYLKRGRRRK